MMKAPVFDRYQGDQFLRDFWPGFLQPLNPEWEGLEWDDLDAQTQDHWRSVMRTMGALVLTKILLL